MTQLLGRALVGRGHAVRVVGIYPNDHGGPGREVDRGVEVWRLRQREGLLGWVRDRWRLYGLVSEWARADAIDLVEVADWGGWAAAWPALGIPIVTRCNGSATYFGAEVQRRVGFMTRKLERSSIARSFCWSAVSQYTARRTQTALRVSTDPAAILYNAVDVPSRYGPGPRDNRTVVFSGTLTEKKGILSLIRAWPLVVQAVGDAELHVFGKGSQAKAALVGMCHHPAASRIHFHGHVAR
jgi:glycosyltransferase involved in cell wall biosynthesis